VKIAIVLGTTSDYLLGQKKDEANEVDSHEDTEKTVQLLGLMKIIFNDYEGFKKITLEDIEEIKNHINYVLYTAKNRDKNN
jgi:hypothetical protein